MADINVDSFSGKLITISSNYVFKTGKKCFLLMGIKTKIVEIQPYKYYVNDLYKVLLDTR